MFRVVVFSEAPEVAVISHKWWQQDDTGEGGEKPRGVVFWPPCKTSMAVDKLLKSHAPPNVGGQWSLHPAISYFATDNLLVARRKAQQAEEESDLTSEAEVGEPAARVRRKNPRFDDGDSEEEARSPARRAQPTGLVRPPLAPRNFGLDNGPQGKPPSGSRHVTVGLSPATTPPTPTSGLSRFRRDAGVDEQRRARSPEAPCAQAESASASGSGCAKPSAENRLLLMMAKALKKLESIEAIALQNRASIEALSERMSAAAGKAAKVSPLQTLSELRELDTCLKSRAHYNEMVEQLSGWCTMAPSDLEKNVRAVMRATVSTTLSEKLSLKGKNGKTPIEGTALFDVICETLRRCGGSERSRVGKAVGAWLSGSRDRNGKRLKRMKDAASAQPEGAAAQPEVAAVQPGTTADTEPQPAGSQGGDGDGDADEVELPMAMW